MTATSSPHHTPRAEQHASEAERLLQSRFLPSHIKAQVHATLALYYSARPDTQGR